MADKKNKNNNFAELTAIVELMESKDLSVVKIKTGDSMIEVERGTRMMGVQMAPSMAAPMAMPTTPVAAMATAGPTVPVADNADAVKSPVVGVVYLAPKPGEPNFIKVGDKVKQGAVLMIVEAMKVMNQIVAPRAGTVTAIMVGNEDPVEFGQPLVTIV
ncbi:MAG: acetyl-CoA carboxylase biotin carboxyl carrier protein [Hydrotalea sp.]|nr:acetyl-CoA carboxylase biotin carboxyl carrier protein [Hydrotalea sp.]